MKEEKKNNFGKKFPKLPTWEQKFQSQAPEMEKFPEWEKEYMVVNRLGKIFHKRFWVRPETPPLKKLALAGGSWIK